MTRLRLVTTPDAPSADRAREAGSAQDAHDAQDAVDLVESLTAALDGRAMVAPLPANPAEQARTLAALAPGDPVVEARAGVVVATSGSTGTPKAVVLSHTALLASAVATHERLGGPGDWVVALPTYYVAGLMGVVRAIAAGTRAIRCRSDLADLPDLGRPGQAGPGARPTPSEHLAAATHSGRRTYISLVPTQLHRALDDPLVTERLRRFSAVLVGGAATPPVLLARARAAGIAVTTTYGMSETCGGCVYDGVPLPGVRVDCSPTGTISLTGPMVFSGYRGRRDLTDRALSGRTFHTADRGRIERGLLIVTGRADDVVVTGGVNVDLAAVERLASRWRPDTVIVGVDDPEWGTAIVAVTAAPNDSIDPDQPGDSIDDAGAAHGPHVRDHPGDLADLRAHLSGRVSPAALPKRLLRVDAWPRTAGGKIDRRRLREMAGLTRPWRETPT